MTTTSGRAAETGALLRRNVGWAAVAGGGAYVVGYLLTAVFALIDGVETVGDIEAWRGVGWAYYGAHNVDIVVTSTVGGRSGTTTLELFGEASEVTNLADTVPVVVYLLVPVLVLSGASYVLVRTVDERPTTVGTAALGATVAVGYLLCVVVGRVLFTYSASSTFFGQEVTVTVVPELWPTVALAGLVYPLLFGAIGAVVAR